MSKGRDFKQERKTAKKRGETGSGSSSGDATRHRARRKFEKENGKVGAGKEVDHKKTLRSGGGNGKANLRARTVKSNRSAGGKAGSKTGKAKGGRMGGKK
jgi:hypothetical protein